MYCMLLNCNRQNSTNIGKLCLFLNKNESSLFYVDIKISILCTETIFLSERETQFQSSDIEKVEIFFCPLGTIFAKLSRQIICLTNKLCVLII